MILLFVKDISVHTNLSNDEVRRIIADIIAGTRKNAEIERLATERWRTRIQLEHDRFVFKLDQPKLRPFERPDLETVMRGNILPANEGAKCVDLSIGLTRVSAWYIGIILLSIVIMFFVALSYSLTQMIIVSSILLLMWYGMAVFSFSRKLRSQQRILNDCFMNTKYDFSHLS